MINIANLLRNAKKGTILWSPLFGPVEFMQLGKNDQIWIRVDNSEPFDKYGRYFGSRFPEAECQLFPSNKVRTWVGWEPPVEPKFKLHDIIMRKGNLCSAKTIMYVNKEKMTYGCSDGKDIPFSEQDLWHLSDSHYFKQYFKPKQWVLVRDCDNQTWGLSRFSHLDMGCYVCINREDFRQCIPFEGNEKLLGTTNACSDIYVNWN